MSKIISKDITVDEGVKLDIVTDYTSAGYATEVLEIKEPKREYGKATSKDSKRTFACVKRIQHNTKNLTAALKEHDQIVEKYCND